MGRTRRLTYPGALHHVTMRCNNKEFLFEEQSLGFFLDVLRETCEKYDLSLYNYCLMTNHVHLLLTVKAADVLSRFMQRLANVFANRFNVIRGRKGHLWEARFVSTIVQPSSYFHRCMAYIDLNPVRAGMVATPDEYQWSGYGFVAAEDERLLRLHGIYLKLGKNKRQRHQAYLKLLEEEAGRPPYSLAGTLFVGTSEFTSRMRRRFGIVPNERNCIRRVNLGGGVEALTIRRSGP
ncbi:MAG: transposase [Planctomycetes bacterium]|nr:transposase [Planctomycetota bacterium]